MFCGKGLMKMFSKWTAAMLDRNKFMIYMQCDLKKDGNNLVMNRKQALVFTCLQYKPFENIGRKGEIARDFSPSVSYP